MTTKRNIRWTPTTEEITTDDLAAIRPRVYKRLKERRARTKRHAEVFTPIKVVKRMNDFLDEDYGERPWREYVDSRRLEITCGEAPFITTRYDTTTVEMIPIQERVGLLDRKLRKVVENCGGLEWALRAVQSVYGYEYQGDSLYLARRNVYLAVCEYLGLDELPRIFENVIVWNFFQTDGLYPNADVFDWREFRKVPFAEIRSNESP